MRLTKEAIEDLGMAILGNCTIPQPVEYKGRAIWPAAYGQYSSTCEACSGFAGRPVADEKSCGGGKTAKQQRVCGNCKYWEISGEYE